MSTTSTFGVVAQPTIKRLASADELAEIILPACVYRLSDNCLQVRRQQQQWLTMDTIHSPCSQLVAADAHLLALSNAQVWSWGYNHLGQLGNGRVCMDYRDTPALIDALDGLAVCKVAAGGCHSAVLTDAQDVMTWGSNTHNQLGRDGCPLTPQLAVFDSLTTSDDCDDNLGPCIVDIACGAKHTVLVDNHGRVWGCGNNDFGQLGTLSPSISSAFSLLKLPPQPDTSLIPHKVSCGRWSTTITYSSTSI
ncbi:RCC1 domain-containing protein 1 [Sorochytrium milnesiophthora]